MNDLVDLGGLHPRLAHLDRPADGFSPGLCRSIGARLGIDPLLIRILFILTTLLSGIGAVAYTWGVLLTPRAGRQAPIHRLLPIFSSWTPRAQWITIALSCILVVGWVAQMASMGPLLLVSVFALLVLFRRRGPRQHAEPQNSSTTPPGEQPFKNSAQLPVVDLYAPEESKIPGPAPQPAGDTQPQPSWWGAILVLSVGCLVAASIVVFDLVPGILVRVALVLGAVGLTILGWGLLKRDRRLPTLLLIPALLAALGIAIAVSTSASETRIPATTGSGRELREYPFMAVGDGVADLRDLPTGEPMTVHVRAFLSQVRVMLPQAPASHHVTAWATEMTWPGGTEPAQHGSEAEGIQLVVDSYLSAVRVEYPL